MHVLLHNYPINPLVSLTILYYYSKEHKAAVLSLVLPEPHLLLTGAFDKKVRIFDLRNKNPVGGACGSHSKPVLSLVSDGSLVYSGSEDKVIKIWDTRKLGEEINKIKVIFENENSILD